MCLENRPELSLISKTKPAKFGSDNCQSALRTAFPSVYYLAFIRDSFYLPFYHPFSVMQTFEILQYVLVSIVLTTSKPPANFPLSMFFDFSR